jgi:glycosyltransferase involved in cell wall biosynthesis
VAATTLVSCLCVTEGRVPFMPWLLWGFDRQVWPARELVIVDSSETPFHEAPRPDVRVLTAPTGTSVPAKRNMALQAARGDVVTWFDDDDWQHPHKLEWLLDALAGGAPYAGSTSAWFVDLQTSRCARYRGFPGRAVFNSAGFSRDAVRRFPFRENRPRASDTPWMRAIAERYRGEAAIVDRSDLFFWLSHTRNLSNPARRMRFPHDLNLLKEQIGESAWGDTDEALADLRVRVAEVAAAAHRDER